MLIGVLWLLSYSTCQVNWLWKSVWGDPQAQSAWTELYGPSISAPEDGESSSRQQADT